MIRFLAVALMICGPVQAQSVPEGSTVAAILATALDECRAAHLTAPATLDIQPAAITWTDLDGDYEWDDAIVDFNHIYCSLGAIWQGTGGAPVHAIVDAASGAPGQVWSGGNWQVIRHGDHPLFLLSRHGIYCDATGSDPCVLAVTFTNGRALIARAAAD